MIFFYFIFLRFCEYNEIKPKLSMECRAHLCLGAGNSTTAKGLDISLSLWVSPPARRHTRFLSISALTSLPKNNRFKISANGASLKITWAQNTVFDHVIS